MGNGFQFRSYRCRFRQPLQTAHGIWSVREGIILRLEDRAGHTGFGEIAPLPWFGSETLEQAWDFCAQLPQALSPEHLGTIPDHLPACQFGFESAWENLTDSNVVGAIRLFAPVRTEISVPRKSLSALLPAGEAALITWQELWDAGYRTFKWKMGVLAYPDEIGIFQNLVAALPSTAQLRLDANSGLSKTVAEQWLQVCDRANGDRPGIIEFMEQPLPPDCLDDLLALAANHSTPIALDESVATLAQLQTCYQKGWRGVFVTKPAIAGSPFQLRQFCRNTGIDAVFSTVFETAIGREAGLRLAIDVTADLAKPDRALGYGTAHWFADAEPEAFEGLWDGCG